MYGEIRLHRLLHNIIVILCMLGFGFHCQMQTCALMIFNFQTAQYQSNVALSANMARRLPNIINVHCALGRNLKSTANEAHFSAKLFKVFLKWSHAYRFFSGFTFLVLATGTMNFLKFFPLFANGSVNIKVFHIWTFLKVVLCDNFL